MLSRDCIAWENQKIIRIATRYNRAAARASKRNHKTLHIDTITQFENKNI
jgi:hypothetical protein